MLERTDIAVLVDPKDSEESDKCNCACPCSTPQDGDGGGPIVAADKSTESSRNTLSMHYDLGGG